jgi:hypothetical protein
MIDWSDCNIDWADATTIGKVTHIPTGAFIIPGPPPQVDGKPSEYDREQLLRALDAKVQVFEKQ